jgi:hypothetical protein
MSVYTVVFVGSTPLGGLLIGSIASAMGVAVALAVGGLACVAVGMVGIAWLKRIRTRDVTIGASAVVPATTPDVAAG